MTVESRAEPSGPLAVLRSIDRYWFGYGSPTTLGVMRICIGFLAFVNWCMIGADWDSWFGERGFVPNWLGSLWFGEKTPTGIGHIFVTRINLLAGVTDPRITVPFYIAVCVCALLTCLGLWTRVAAFLLAVGTVTLHHRNGAILHGGDTVLRICTIYLAVSPCGRACSLDRLIALWKGRESHAPVKSLVTAQRLFSFNVALIYFTTLWLKMDGDKWRPTFMGGKLLATYYPERLAEFYRFPVPEFFKSVWMSYFTTGATITVEFSLATLVFFRPMRKWAILGGVLLHGYIEYGMNIPLFSFLMMSMYLAFYDGQEISSWAERTGLRLRRFHVSVRLPKGMQLQPRAVAFLDAIDPFKMVSYLPGEASTWQATRYNGSSILATRAVWTRSLGGWLWGWPRGVMDRILNSSLEAAPEPNPALDDEDSRPRRKKIRR